MTTDPWLSRFPPPPPLTSVARGSAADGTSWEIQVGGNSENLLTFLTVRLPTGEETGGGGMGGPPLRAGRLMSVSVHRCDPGLHYVVGRVAPQVASVRIQLAHADPAEVTMRPVGTSSEFGVSFVAAILPAEADVVAFTALAEDGARIEERHAHFPGQESPDTDGVDFRDGWSPPPA